MEADQRWRITDPSGRVAATAATEGQAWIRFLDYEGEELNGWWFIGAVNHFKSWKYRAEEAKEERET